MSLLLLQSSDEEQPSPLPQTNPSTSATDRPVPTSKVSKQAPSAKHSSVSSAQPGPSQQQAAKPSRWDKQAKITPGNHPPPVVNPIPSSHIPERPQHHPPPPVEVQQRPPQDLNRHPVPYRHGKLVIHLQIHSIMSWGLLW